MSRDPTETRVRFGARLAVALAALVGAGLGLATGVPGATLLGLVAGGVLAGSGRALADEENARRAAGSAGLVVGGVALVAAVRLAAARSGGAAVLVAAVSLGVAAVVLDALVETPGDASPPVGRAARRSVAVLVPFALLGTAWASGLVTLFVVGPVAVGIALVNYSAFLSLVVLQVLALVAMLLVQEALPVLDSWIDADGDPLAALDRVGLRLREVPRAFWALLGVQVLVLLFDPGGTWFAAALSALSVLGTVIHAVLVYGVLHAPLAAVALLAGLVLLARGVQRTVLWWAGPSPGTALSFGAGGLLAAGVAVLLGAIPPTAALLTDGLWSVGFGGFSEALGATAAALLVVGLLVGAVRWTVLAFPAAASVGAIPASAGGYAVGATALFVGALAAAASGATAVVAFAGAAGALLVWDLGENTTVLREQLGGEVDTRRVEITHATGSVGVGVAAVLASTLAYYLIGRVGIAPPDESHALLALALALVGLVSFVYVAENPLGDAEGSE